MEASDKMWLEHLAEKISGPCMIRPPKEACGECVEIRKRTMDVLVMGWNRAEASGLRRAAEIADERVTPMHQGGGRSIEGANHAAQMIAATCRSLASRVERGEE